MYSEAPAPASAGFAVAAPTATNVLPMTIPARSRTIARAGDGLFLCPPFSLTKPVNLSNIIVLLYQLPIIINISSKAVIP
jgi:hypothetical protein